MWTPEFRAWLTAYHFDGRELDNPAVLALDVAAQRAGEALQRRHTALCPECGQPWPHSA